MLDVYVFSYNRPQFLDNCLASIQRHSPGARVRVFDDDSRDPGVAEVLERWREQHSVRLIPRGAATAGLHGGLYNNMQRAFETGVSEGVELALYIQDDMQLVRDIRDFDIDNAKRYFATTPNTIELYVSYFKEMYRHINKDGFDFDNESKVYLSRVPRKTAPGTFCDVGFFHFGRMKELAFSFAQGEGENAEKMLGSSFVMACYAYPFMMNLPFPKTEYYRSKQFLLRAAEWWVCAGFYPYEPMSPAKVAGLLERDLETLPEAEDYLSAQGLDKPGPWIFGGAIIGMIEIGGVRGWIAGKAGRLIKTGNDCKAAFKILGRALSRAP
jgi:glycosyltransferase involved in cell wall biosynthesis